VNDDAITIRVRVRLDGEWPVGDASDEHGRGRPFAGWIGLVAAIDELVTVPPAQEPPVGR
jgi:hypothetical protein